LWLYEGARKRVWCARWRDHDGRHEKRLCPAWEGKGPPPPGLLRREAQALLDDLLVEARRGTRRQERTGLTFAILADEWFEHGKFERDWSASTQVGYRSVLDAHLIKAFGPQRVETITTKDIQTWRDSFAKKERPDGEPKRTRHTVNKIVTQLHAIFEHAVDYHDLLVNSVAKVKRLRESYDAARFDFFSPEEIDRLVATAAAGGHRDPSRPAVSDTERALRATEDEQDAAIYLTAALSGLRRGELLALRWSDVDFEQSSIRVFEGHSANTTGKPKSRKSRTVPMVDKVSVRLAELKRRGHHTGKTDLVFASRDGTNVDGSALRRRYHATLNAAGLRRLRFHDLRHTFGSAGDQRRLDRAGPGVDGPRRHQDHHALPASQEPRGRRPAAIGRLRAPPRGRPSGSRMTPCNPKLDGPASARVGPRRHAHHVIEHDGFEHVLPNGDILIVESTIRDERVERAFAPVRRELREKARRAYEQLRSPVDTTPGDRSIAGSRRRDSPRDVDDIRQRPICCSSERTVVINQRSSRSQPHASIRAVRLLSWVYCLALMP